MCIRDSLDGLQRVDVPEIDREPFREAIIRQAKGYIDRYDVKYVFATNGHLYGEFDKFTSLQDGPIPFADFPLWRIKASS